jgi:1-pyrroline-5-carboxylate dehydrogenase
MHALPNVPEPVNEPVLSYAPGTPERAELKARLAELSSTEVEIPLLIGGREVRTGNFSVGTMPHDHDHVVARWHLAGEEEARAAMDAAVLAQKEWASWPWQERVSVFLRAAELVSGRHRATLNASTMLGQSKTAHQAEIDASAELADFFRFNAYFAQTIYQQQPQAAPGMWNWLDYRPIEGFVYAISPFNFTSIGGNLSGAPALMGCGVLWKPSHSAVYSNYFIARIFEEAGMPPGVINFVPGKASMISDIAFSHPDFAGVHFTGSTGVFQGIWSEVGKNIARYRGYPRLVGETGGKDFLIAHPSADPEAVVTAIVRGGFEYQGQKCSALSRAYIPASMWSEIETALIETTEGLKMGDPADFTNYMSAVIHKEAFADITGYIEGARASDDAEIIAGGQSDDSEGYFIRPTIIRALRPDYVTMCDEIFGPVVTVYIYPDAEWHETLALVDRTSPYALTGAVFADDRRAVMDAHAALRFAAGNFYVNDKPTGAVVGQQPFGGARASGTNDKAGSVFNLLRWVSPRTVKETFVPPRDYRYPFMDAE